MNGLVVSTASRIREDIRGSDTRPSPGMPGKGRVRRDRFSDRGKATTDPGALRLPEKEVRNVFTKQSSVSQTKAAVPEISVIIPAYNEEGGIGDLISRLHTVMGSVGRSYEVLVVDDCSADDTAGTAQRAGARIVRHPYNIGNGAAVKTGIRNARGEILVMLDADGQHPPEYIPELLEKVIQYHMAVGARTKSSDTSIHRDLANTVYNWLATYVSGRRIDDLTSGFRAVRAHVAREFVSLLPNTFSYPTTITLATIRSGYSLTYVPIKAAKRAAHSKSKIRLVRDGSRFLLIIFKIATLFSPMKIFLPASVLTFLLGLGYGLYKVVVLDGRYGPTSALMMTFSVLMFLIGLVSEQIAQGRFDRMDFISAPMSLAGPEITAGRSPVDGDEVPGERADS
jgi:glycosyltransferase involved in cell wall biosynthesis